MWVVLTLSMCIEVYAALHLIRQVDPGAQGLGPPLIATNLVTWVPFILAVEALEPIVEPYAGWVTLLAIVGLELLVVIVEAGLILVVTKGLPLPISVKCRGIGLREALLVSLAANVVSVAASWILTPVVFLLAMLVFSAIIA